MKKQAAKNGTAIVPIILSGGMGTRLWPLSRGSYPKQFLNLSTREYSLIQETLLRVKDKKKFMPPVIVCNQEHRFLVAEKANEVSIKNAAIILEPSPRNTAPALALAAFYVKENYKNAVMIVLPSDHIIHKGRAFQVGLDKAIAAAKKGYLVTFGIVPEYPETGYGYIKRGKAIKNCSDAYIVDKFVEKPDKKTASQYVESGDYSWNSGMFAMPAELYISELSKYHPDIIKLSQASYKAKKIEKDYIWIEKKSFSKNKKLSIDYAVMEKTKHAAIVPLNCGWNDAGAWDTLWKIFNKDDNGNVLRGECYDLETKNSFLSAENGMPIATLGVEDLVIITTKDCVMVANKKRAQEVKDLVAFIKEKKMKLIENHRQIYRPWGHYDSIDTGFRYQVKRLTIKPGAKISLQMHYHRAEHWVVVQGTAKITCGNKEHVLTENQSIYIPNGTIHRIENPGKLELEIIEVQSGSYLGEDDIVRFEDNYGRK